MNASRQSRLSCVSLASKARGKPLRSQRVADQRLLRLIGKWLKAGVIENGRRVAATKGTPQGAVISPLLANIYLHYVLDQWTACVALNEKSRRMTGIVVLARPVRSVG